MNRRSFLSWLAATPLAKFAAPLTALASKLLPAALVARTLQPKIPTLIYLTDELFEDCAFPLDVYLQRREGTEGSILVYDEDDERDDPDWNEGL